MSQSIFWSRYYQCMFFKAVISSGSTAKDIFHSVIIFMSAVTWNQLVGHDLIRRLKEAGFEPGLTELELAEQTIRPPPGHLTGV